MQYGVGTMPFLFEFTCYTMAKRNNKEYRQNHDLKSQWDLDVMDVNGGRISLSVLTFCQNVIILYEILYEFST